MKDESNSGVQRDEPEIDESQEQFISKWQSKIRAALKYFEPDYQRIREDMMLARQGASDNWVNSGQYVVPIINRYINQSVSSLYAKNPTAHAEKRRTLDFELWDGKPETLQSAIEGASLGDQQSLAILEDVERGRQNKMMIDKIGRTLEICFDYYANEQKPRLKSLMKSMVRRAKTCGVAYLMLGFQRSYAELTPDETAKLEDCRNKMGELQRRMQDVVDDEISDSQQSEIYELETLIKSLENKNNNILREGPVFMFPKATEIIIDPACKQLMGFIGAGWIARQFYKTPNQIQKIYNVDIKGGYTSYNKHNIGDMVEYYRSSEDRKGCDEDKGMVCVWEVYNKDLGQTFTIADGYKGFLKPCREPDYWMEGFWNVFAITFDDCESEDKLYPLSNVHQLRHVQAEYNRSREYRRLHREANKPKYVVLKGKLSEYDKKLLGSHPPHAVIELDGLDINANVNNIIQPFRPVPIDPALYETNSEMEDILRIVGAQEANVGGMSGGTATESSIAESSRMTSLSSNVDDLDEFLTDVVSATGQLMLMELSSETVKEIAGVGAVWPEFNREQIAKQVLLKVKAGSSGRPNKAAELANMERGMPYILQLPGMNPFTIGKRYLDLLEMNIEEAIVEGLPSIQAINSQIARAAQATNGGNDPTQQGDKGFNNIQSTEANEQGSQPSYQTI